MSDGAALRPPEIIETRRLRMRPVTPSDGPVIFDTYASQDAPTRFMDFRRHREPAEAEAFAERCGRGWRNGPFYPWAITDRGSAAFMGTIELRLMPPRAEFGYILGAAFWGCGFMTEAASAVVDWAINQSGIYRVWATCHPENTASARVLEKVGLVLETALANWTARPQLGEIAGPSLVYARLRPSP